MFVLRYGMSCFASSCYRRPPPRFASGSYDVTVTLFKFAFSGVLHASEPQSQMSVCYRYESRSALPGPLLSMRSMMCGNRNPPPCPQASQSRGEWASSRQGAGVQGPPRATPATAASAFARWEGGMGAVQRLLHEQ